MADFLDLIRAESTAAAHLVEATAAGAAESIQSVGLLLAERLAAGSKVLAFGNGGSAADAQHLASELVGRYVQDRPSLPALALTTDTTLLTAVSNDYGYEHVFARQVSSLAQPGDVVVGISTSGRSPNVLAGLRAARGRSAYTVALLGADTSQAAPLADFIISVPSRQTPRIQEVHALVIHLLCAIIERCIFPGLEQKK